MDGGWSGIGAHRLSLSPGLHDGRALPPDDARGLEGAVADLLEREPGDVARRGL